MTRPTLLQPERGDARTRLLDAARDLIRQKGFAATSVDDLCRAAGVTKGAFFHHFPTKEALGVASAEYWSETTGAFFADAPYHAPEDALQRVLAYIAFRKSIIVGQIYEFACVAGTLLQETYDSAPAIRAAAGASVLDHAATLEADIAAAMRAADLRNPGFTAQSLARHTQAVIQGAFILAKAGNDPELAKDTIDHLARYVCLLFKTEEAIPA